MIVERSRDDFSLRLRNCLVSVSQAGYNTVMETLQAGARGAVPFAAGSEEEQTIRAQLLAERGLVHVVEESAYAGDARRRDRSRRPRAAPGAACDREVHRAVQAAPDARRSPCASGSSDLGGIRSRDCRRGGAKFWWRDDDAAAASPS